MMGDLGRLLALLLPCFSVSASSLDTSTIPDFDNLSFLLSTATNMTLYDTDKFRRCVAGKHVLCFGDSTMTEFVDDLAMLISGIGNQTAVLDDYVYRSTHVPSKSTSPTTITLPLNVTVGFYNFHRNMTIVVPTIDAFIRYRYTGAVDLHQGREGLSTFSDARFTRELAWLLGTRPQYSVAQASQAPDVIVMGSLHHDFKHGLEQFERRLHWAFKFLTTKLPNTRIIWKSTALFWSQRDPEYLPFLFPYEDVAARAAKQYNVIYVNVTEAYHSIVQDRLLGKELQYTTGATVAAPPPPPSHAHTLT